LFSVPYLVMILMPITSKKEEEEEEEQDVEAKLMPL
jgi:hypothetical protein